MQRLENGEDFYLRALQQSIIEEHGFVLVEPEELARDLFKIACELGKPCPVAVMVRQEGDVATDLDRADVLVNGRRQE